jgi:hypothetical protein
MREKTTNATIIYSLKYAWKPYKYKNYSLILLIMYGSSYMFGNYISIFRERS